MAKLTQKKMCAMADVSTSLMSKYLTAKKCPTLKTAKRIAVLCNVPMEIFLKVSIQEEFFGKSFLKEDVEYMAKTKKQNEVDK
ncbi:MAG TPA: XRE family transcriptional regulator [Sulfurimonas autotrophica]|nr:XRE family transcriptional regulator [Sulfurimonas autotrophica]